MNYNVVNKLGEVVKEIELNEAVFGVEYNEQCGFDAIMVARSNSRQATAKTKKRNEVSGGGKKPFRQKGTGRARQGSSREPQMVGGGVVFGVTPRSYTFKMNKKEKQLALKSALTSKVNDSKLIVVDELKMEAIKTKDFKAVMTNLNANKALVVMAEKDENVVMSAKNIPDVNTALTSTINVYDIMKAGTVVLTKDAVAKIEEVYA